ncbi:MAG: hypothetical protein Q7R35_06240 [Elusimicrobiota bacterium]|nr:hypothetical protein [Elusimicrobiota bacterium]
MTRGLNEEFIHDLMAGSLKPLYEEIREDDTLDLQIRDNYLNIYYRGGSILKLTKVGNTAIYLTDFDANYLYEEEQPLIRHKCIEDEKSLYGWISLLPGLKRCMDKFFHRHPKNEREFAQNFVRENNRTKIIVPGPDYFICDVEYSFTVPGAKGQFDAVAVKWDSTAVARKNPRGLRLALIELKFGDGALAGKAGIEKHITDAEKFLANYDQSGFRAEMKTVFNQKRKLGYILNRKDIESFSDEKPEYIFILANHDPASTAIKQVLSKIEEPSAFDLRFARASFFGSGLYSQNVITLKDLKAML